MGAKIKLPFGLERNNGEAVTNASEIDILYNGEERHLDQVIGEISTGIKVHSDDAVADYNNHNMIIVNDGNLDVATILPITDFSGTNGTLYQYGEEWRKVTENVDVTGKTWSELLAEFDNNSVPLGEGKNGVKAISLEQYIKEKTITCDQPYVLYTDSGGSIITSHYREWGDMRFDCFVHYNDGKGCEYIITAKSRNPKYKNTFVGGLVRADNPGTWQLLNAEEEDVEVLEGKTAQEWADLILLQFNEDLREKTEKAKTIAEEAKAKAEEVDGKVAKLDEKVGTLASQVDEGVTQASASAQQAEQSASNAEASATRAEATVVRVEQLVGDPDPENANAVAIAEVEERVDELEKELSPESEVYLNLTNKITGWWLSNSAKWSAVANSSFVLVNVSDINSLTIKSNDRFDSYYFLLKTYTTPTSQNLTPDFCSGHNQREILTKGTEKTIELPSDCNFIAFANVYGPQPTEIYLPTYAYYTKVSKLYARINALEKEEYEHDERIKNLEQTIGKEETVKLDNLITGWWLSSSAKWLSNSKSSFVLVDVEGMSNLIVQANSNFDTYYFLLRSYVTPTSTNLTPDFCNGFDSRLLINAGREISINLPNDCKYVAFANIYEIKTEVYLPTSVKLIKEESLIGKVQSLENKVNNNDTSSYSTLAQYEALARTFHPKNMIKALFFDVARKYISPSNIKTIINTIASSGYNTIVLHLSEDEGFRFSLNDMVVEANKTSYDLSLSIGKGITAIGTPEDSDKFLTESEMDDIIATAQNLGLEVIPSFDMPSHMGSILKAFPQFKIHNSNRCIDFTDKAATDFAFAIMKKYIAYFKAKGCKQWILGADEIGITLTNAEKEQLSDFVNKAAEIVLQNEMLPSVFNDNVGIYPTGKQFNRGMLVWYWTKFNNLEASDLEEMGYSIVNMPESMYFTLVRPTLYPNNFNVYRCQLCSKDIERPKGGVFSIWCGRANHDGTDEGAAIVTDTNQYLQDFGTVMRNQSHKVVLKTLFQTTIPANGISGVEVQIPHKTMLGNVISGTVNNFSNCNFVGIANKSAAIDIVSKSLYDGNVIVWIQNTTSSQITIPQGAYVNLFYI